MICRNSSTIIQFFNGFRQSVIPLYQRPYEWQEKRWIDQYSGNLFYINTFGNYSSRQTARVKTYGDVISDIN